MRQETLWFLKVKRRFRVIKARVIKGPYELEALKSVAQYMFPKVHETYPVDGRLYIEMEYFEEGTLQVE